MNICVLEPKPRIDIGSNFVIGLDDVLDVHIYKVIERVDVLFDETFYFEKSGEEKPFVLVTM